MQDRVDRDKYRELGRDFGYHARDLSMRREHHHRISDPFGSVPISRHQMEKMVVPFQEVSGIEVRTGS
jgi:hypothetical protein